MKIFAHEEEQLTVRVVELRATDGTPYWQGRFVLEVGGGAKWHGVTVVPHDTREAAERDALAQARSKTWAPGTSPPIQYACNKS